MAGTIPAHSTWSASATDRNVNCPGAIAFTHDLPETTSEAADWGTCCHELAESCLTRGGDAADHIGRTLRGKRHENVVDDEMAETAQAYVDYVRKRAAVPGTTLLVEQRFSLASLNPPFDAGGTADSVLYTATTRHLEVVDLKGGRGVVVAAKGNAQLRTYGLGAMLAAPDLRVETVTVTIVQPRADHPDGRIRSETFHVVDLLEWTADLIASMHKAAEASVAYAAIGTAAVPSLAVWASNHLAAGDHCKFCKAAGFCPALEQKALDAAGVWFDADDVPRIANRPDAMSPAELAKRLDALDMIAEWINEVRAYAHREAEAGVEIPGYQLVDKVGRRAWTVDEADVAKTLLAHGVDENRIYNRKVVSPAQAEKLLGAKKKTAIEGLAARPERGTNLVAVGKTTRAPAVASVNKHFTALD